MEKIITLDKGQSATINTNNATTMQISLKEGAQDYGLLVSGGGISQKVVMENITQPVKVAQDTELTLTLVDGNDNVSYDFIIQLMNTTGVR
ncbi:MAG: hypothetical protein JST76_11480 [Bacteroidetes bacterium]|nr:hypothetical protein [Bacteroidota bacterium]